MTALKHKIVFALLCCSFALFAQDADSYMFRIYLKDKAESPFEITKPQDFLTQKAIDRRVRQDIAITENDLPVSEEYIHILQSLNCKIVAKSKWMNTVAIVCRDSSFINEVKVLNFVSAVKFVWKGGISNDVSERKFHQKNKKTLRIAKSGEYGAATDQILIHQADTLHKMGYKGEGMEIAVIDGGFSGMDQDHLLLSTVSIKGGKDFVYKGIDMYKSSNHGTEVLSCMGTNVKDTYIGTAPKASYWLLRSEDTRSEFPIEEDYWATAAEYADSLGVDLINTSLGYSRFDFPAQSYIYSDMNGETAYITQAADIAASKGIVVVVSAGNEGAKAWRHITAPGDNKKGLTIGAIAADSIIAAFSSRGPTFDGRIKPDVMAIGQNTAVINQLSEIVSASGTSFSSPVMCGIAACFWQANPHLTSKQVVDILRESGNRYSNPDNSYGYGIPNIPRAWEIIKNLTSTQPEIIHNVPVRIITDSTTSTIGLIKETNDQQACSVWVYSIDGKFIGNHTFSDKEYYIQLVANQSKVFIIRIQQNDIITTTKVCL